MTEALSGVGEDFYRALVGALALAPSVDAAVALQAIREAREWRTLGPDVRGIFALAAATFLSDGE